MELFFVEKKIVRPEKIIKKLYNIDVFVLGNWPRRKFYHFSFLYVFLMQIIEKRVVSNGGVKDAGCIHKDRAHRSFGNIKKSEFKGFL